MNIKHKILTASICFGLASAPNVFADADISVQPVGIANEATANVDLVVVVPKILIFGVGAVGTPVAKLTWSNTVSGVASGTDNATYSGTIPSLTTAQQTSLYTTPVNVVLSDGTGTGTAATNTATLPVYIFSNSGSDVTITETITGDSGTVDALDDSGAGSGTIPISEFTFANGVGSITNPHATGSGVTTHTSGIVNLAGTWTYQYVPASVPVAGTYEARITYVAATP